MSLSMCGTLIDLTLVSRAALTAQIVLVQSQLLRATAKFHRSKRYNCLANMVSDAVYRKCITLNRHLDMYPDAVRYRESTGATETDLARSTDEQDKLEFIKQSINYWKSNARREPPSVFNETEIYHTSKGDTTRPIGNPDLVDRADKHEKEVAEQKRPQEEEARQLAQAVDVSTENFPPLPGAQVDKMDTTSDSQVEVAQNVRESGGEDSEDDGDLRGNVVVEDDDDAASNQDEQDFDM